MKSELFICVWLYLLGSVWSQDPMVMTTQGPVRGSRSQDGDYSLFMGIPYATVDPENPFGDPLPAPIFDSIFEAHDDSAMCPQREEFNNTISGTLDCLHVNIYIPRLASSTNRLPVMVYIHGGSFLNGFAGRYVLGPQYLVRHDIILVTLNYRLGVYGFMCLDNPRVPGNSGLKDQQAGLRWVHENIAAFGGDSNSITIFGESAGSMSVELHVLSPGSRGLFHRAIMQSGSVLIDLLNSNVNPTAALELADRLGYHTENTDDALDFLKYANPDELIKTSEDLEMRFMYCTENVFEAVDPFLPESPLNLLKTGQYEKLPILIGYNSEEWLVVHLSNARSNENYFNDMRTLFFDTIGSYFNFENTYQLESAVKIVTDYYIGTQVINEKVQYDLIHFDSDLIFNHPIERSLSYHLNNSDFPIYQYVFAYSGEVNFVKRRNNITEGGAAHADDLGFLFKQIYMPDENSPEDQLIIDQMTKMWTNFARYGDPTPGVSELLPVRWPAVLRDSRDYLWIDSEIKVLQKPYHQRMAFWDLFFTAYGQFHWLEQQANNQQECNDSC